MYTGPESRSGTQGNDLVTSSIALANVVASCRWPRMLCGMSGHRYRVTAVEWHFVWRRCTKWNV